MLVDLALVGFGHVGRRFARLLDERRDRLERELDLTCRITGIATRRHGAIYTAGGPRRAGRGAARRGGRIAGRPARVGGSACVAGSHDVIAALSTSSLRCACSSKQRRSTSRPPSPRSITSGSRSRPAAMWSPPTRALSRSRTRSCRRSRPAAASFLFEGAVMDGIPVFNLVRETMPAVQDRRVPRRREQHDEPHSDRARGRGRVRARARAHAGGGHRGSRSVARRRRLGRGGEGCGARQRVS